MGLAKNAMDAGIITLCFYFGSIAMGAIGIDFAKETIMSPLGVVVSYLLALMETTYNRF